MRQRGIAIRYKPWPSRNAGRFAKEDFAIHALRKTPEGRATLRERTPIEDCVRRCAAINDLEALRGAA